MNGMYKGLRLLMAMLLAAFALPAVADGGDTYRLNISSTPGAGGAITATITNRAGFDALKSFTITAPPGVYITAVASGSSNIPLSKITPPNPATAGGTITVSNVAIWYNQSGTLKITATFPTST